MSFGEYTMDERASTMRARDHKDSTDLVIQHIDGGEVARTLKAEHDGSPTPNGSGYDVIAFSCKDYGNGAATNISPTLRAMNAVDGNPNGGGQMAVAIPIHEKATRYKGGGDQRNDDGSSNGLGIGREGDPCPTITTGDRHGFFYATHDVSGTMVSRKESGGFSNSADHAAAGYMAVSTYGVRRLTPRECERLQGFPDDKTLIAKSSDSARYKALGNSMAVPCMRWIGERIQKVEEVLACRAS